MKRFFVDYKIEGMYYFEAENIEEAREMVEYGEVNEVINNEIDDVEIIGVYED